MRDKTDKKIGKLIVDIACGRESALDELFYLTKEQMYFVAYRYSRDKEKNRGRSQRFLFQDLSRERQL